MTSMFPCEEKNYFKKAQVSRSFLWSFLDINKHFFILKVWLYIFGKKMGNLEPD